MAHLPFSSVFLKHIEQPAGRVDAAGHQHGVAVAAHQPIASGHVPKDVGDNLLQPVTGAEHLLQGAPAFLELRPGVVVQALGLELEPLVDLLLRGECAGRCPAPRSAGPAPRRRVPPRRTCRCGYRAEDSMLFFLSFFSSGVPVKPIRVASGSRAFIASCSLPDWVRWHSSTNTNRLPLARKPLGRWLRISRMKASTSPSSETPNLWISEAISHSSLRLSTCDQVRAAAGAVDLLVHALEDLLDLLVQLGAVGDHQHPGIGDILADPLRQPHHGQRLAAALGVPDDAALAPLHVSRALRARRSTGCAGRSS